MTQENKNLLLHDLCMRLPYGVIMRNREMDCDFELDGKTELTLTQSIIYLIVKFNSVPYLRPMSSMTEEEIKTYHSYCECDHGDFTGEILYFDTIDSFDYLTSIHIDYRGLIEKGLAIEVTEENNPYKE